MTAPVIRAYRPADDAALFAFDERVVTDPARMSLMHRAHAASGLWVAEVDGRVAGYVARTRDFYGQEFIALLVVDQASRRCGIGTALMQRIEDGSTHDRVFTSANESNAPMRALLARLGYRASGRIENLDPGDPELVFVKFLERPPG